MKLFYSWQSDTPYKIGRHFIREAIDQAISDISEAPDIIEADRPEVTSDTQGVLGSPAIAETIFQKIRATRVVIADVTLVGKATEKKKLINSNVAIELGYVLGQLGDEALLLVKNTHYGALEELPFDLRHRRGGVEFNLRPNASKSEISEERTKLAKKLVSIFKEYLKTPAVPKEPYIPQQPTLNPSAYWQEGEIALQTDSTIREEGKNLGYGSKPRMFLHIWPDQKLTNFNIVQMFNPNPNLLPPLCDRSHGWYCKGNKYGFISYESSGELDELYSATQIFKDTGEVWGINSYLLSDINFGTTVLKNFISNEAYENAMERTLKLYLKVAWDNFEYPDIIHVSAGLTDVEGYKYQLQRNTGKTFWGRYTTTIPQKSV